MGLFKSKQQRLAEKQLKEKEAKSDKINNDLNSRHADLFDSLDDSKKSNNLRAQAAGKVDQVITSLQDDLNSLKSIVKRSDSPFADDTIENIDTLRRGLGDVMAGLNVGAVRTIAKLFTDTIAEASKNASSGNLAAVDGALFALDQLREELGDTKNRDLFANEEYVELRASAADLEGQLNSCENQYRRYKKQAADLKAKYEKDKTYIDAKSLVERLTKIKTRCEELEVEKQNIRLRLDPIERSLSQKKMAINAAKLEGAKQVVRDTLREKEMLEEESEEWNELHGELKENNLDVDKDSMMVGTSHSANTDAITDEAIDDLFNSI